VYLCCSLEEKIEEDRELKLYPLKISIGNSVGQDCSETIETIIQFSVFKPSQYFAEEMHLTSSVTEEFTCFEKIRSLERFYSPRNTYEILCGDLEDLELTDEGTKALFELLEKPDPKRDEIIQKALRVSNKEQRSKFGKERVYVDFKLKE